MSWQITAIMFILLIVAGLWFLSVTSRPQLIILQEQDWEPTNRWYPGLHDISGSEQPRIRTSVGKWWEHVGKGKPQYPPGLPGMDTTPYWNRIEGRMMGRDEVRSTEDF